MLAIYLNSLYNLLVRNNLAVVVWVQLRKNTRAFWNLRRNMKRAEKRLVALHVRTEQLEQYMARSTSQPSRFNVTR